MRIAIASGKGGTGKTTVAVNLALSLAEKTRVMLLDCDVEEPNDNIFLNIELSKVKDVNLLVPSIDKSRCNFCGDCARFCQYNALAVLPNDILFFPHLCHSCGGCKLVCQREAISEEERKIGVIEKGERKNILLYQGLLNISEPMSTPIIKELKKTAFENNRYLTIIDVPPGTACPVIESVYDTDYCILVTEPTPFGLHDLKLAVEMIRTLKIPFGVIINRDSVGNKDVEEYCAKENIPILMKIPQDEEIAKLYSIGVPFIKELDEWKEQFIDLYNYINESVKNETADSN